MTIFFYKLCISNIIISNQGYIEFKKDHAILEYFCGKNIGVTMHMQICVY